MAAAIWSCPTNRMLAFPMASFARFFSNHGLLNLSDRPQWKTVRGGSWSYVKKLSTGLKQSYQVDSPVICVSRQSGNVRITLADGQTKTFDEVVMACHADETLALLEKPTAEEFDLLSCFKYQANTAWLHTDTSLMPQSRQVWSAWNYLAAADPRGRTKSVSVTYWMNRLQHLDTQHDYLVSLNPIRNPQEERVIKQMIYHHPVFDTAAMDAQKKLSLIQGQDRVWFCGSYFGYGFHEDALQSSVQVAHLLGTPAPWYTHNDQAHDLQDLQQVAEIARGAGI